MDSLNKNIQFLNLYKITEKNPIYPSFKLYVDILEEASKAISSINCPVKQTISSNLQAIKKAHVESQKRKREQSSYQDSRRSTYSGGSTYSESRNTDSNFGGYIIAVIVFIFILGMCN